MTIGNKIKSILSQKGYAIVREERLTGGINSRVYKVSTSTDEEYALKIYKKATKEDPRDRFKTEIEFIKYGKLCGAKQIPEIIESEEGADTWALLSWIDGSEVKELSDSDIRDVAKFIAGINPKGNAANLSRLRKASEACICPQEFARGLESRVCSTEKLASSGNKFDKIAGEWVTERIRPIFYQAANEWLSKLETGSQWKDLEKQQIASPSDIGIHNMLRAKSGLNFMDFEYSGRDDLSKLVSDLILQPNYTLGYDQEMLLMKHLREEIAILPDESWIERVQDLKPLIHIKWCIIMLNKLRDRHQPNKQLRKVMKYFEKGISVSS